MKQKIRLTESDLHRIVRESVKRTLLKEDTRREDVINALRQANELIRSVYPTLIELNRDEQFDYITSGSLSDEVINIEEIMKRIDKIVFQQ